MVPGVHAMDIGEWYTKKYSVSDKNIASAGSCFAQHIGHALKRRGFSYVDVEQAPAFLDKSRHLDYGYGMYSARFGNIYTSRQLLQLIQRATGEFFPSDRFWQKGAGYVDPFRPQIEPEPLTSPDEVEELRRYHLKAVSALFEQSDVFVFTLGLTEAWISTIDGAAFPVAPGTAGGQYNPTKYKFLNLTYSEVLDDMEVFIANVRSINSRMNFLLTVSPVPLVATASNDQVIVATVYSKSVLRAVAGFLAGKYDFVDYFPSYEIISSSAMRGIFFNPDMRTVSTYGVEHVMKQFFKEHIPPQVSTKQKRMDDDAKDYERIVCEEELAAVFEGMA
jgi:GSCFA family